MTHEELNEMMQQQLGVALAAFQAAQQTFMGATAPPVQAGVAYKRFKDCQPLSFQGTEGAVELLRWLEKTESVFALCETPAVDWVKFASGTFVGAALTWWNCVTQTLGLGEANAMPWADFVRRLKEEYCPREEIKRLEQEYGNLKMVGSEVEEYTIRHNELAVMCPGLSTPEYRRIEQYLAGLVPEIAGLVSARDPTTMLEAVRSATKMTNLKIAEGVLPPRGSSVKAPAENKRKWESVDKGSSGTQRQPAAKKTEASGSASDQKQGGYAGKSPKCGRCGFHHFGTCESFRCERCQKTGHLAKDCRVNLSRTTQTTAITTPAPQGNQGCFHCGEAGHFKRSCPKLNQGGTGTAGKDGDNEGGGRLTRAHAYVIGARENQVDPDTVTRTYSLLSLVTLWLHFYPHCCAFVLSGVFFVVWSLFLILWVDEGPLGMLLGRYQWISYTDHSRLQ